MYVDNLTAIMLFVVTLVSFLVHLFSMGYMHGERRYNRFYAYLALFTFSMLGLIITSNLLLLFLFWELVGACSYFLIGFYFEKNSAAAACKKAFITRARRIGGVSAQAGKAALAAATLTGLASAPALAQTAQLDAQSLARQRQLQAAEALQARNNANEE